MSVFGGDSWAREKHNRKQKIDDLFLSASSSSSFKKLSSGKYMCLICPHNPILDSPLMFSVHNKGASHISSQKDLKDKEILKQQELDKIIALSSHTTIKSNRINNSNKDSVINQDNPLVEETRRAILELQSNKFKDLSAKDLKGEKEKIRDFGYLEPSERREKEMKFIAAGWKRDGFGKWYRDENVEFDSDEEDPNTCLG